MEDCNPGCRIECGVADADLEMDEDGQLFEACPDCPDEGGCMTCWDSGLVPHGCREEA